MLLATGELGGESIGLVGQADSLEVVSGGFEPFGLRSPPEEVEREHRVLESGQGRQQLENWKMIPTWVPRHTANRSSSMVSS